MPSSQALESLRTVEVATRPPPEEDFQAAAIIERCTVTVRELKGPLPAHLLCESDRCTPLTR
jgi:hypothetical protein